MRKVNVQELSEEAFRKYGAYQDLTNNKQMAARAVTGDGSGEGGFYADLVWLEFDRAKNTPSASVCHIKKSEKRVVNFLEYHQTTCEGLLPIDDDIIIYVGVPAGKELTVETLQAFRVPKGTFIKLLPTIVHGNQFPVNNAEAHVLCLLPARTFDTDLIARHITDEAEMAELV